MELYEYEREHRDLLRRLAPECMVLLKSDGTFPLEAPCKVALYGSGARETIKGGTGSGDVNVRHYTTVEKAWRTPGSPSPPSPAGELQRPAPAGPCGLCGGHQGEGQRAGCPRAAAGHGRRHARARVRPAPWMGKGSCVSTCWAASPARARTATPPLGISS